METNSREWLIPLTGLGFIVLGIVSFIVGGEPKSADDPAREIVNWYVDNKDSVEAGSFIGVAAGVMLLFFGSYLRRYLRERAGERDMLSVLSLVGIVFVVMGIAIDTTISIALAEGADDISPVAVQALQALWDNDFVPLALGCVVFLLGTGLSAIRTGALPKWLGWVMVVLGLLGLTPIGFVSAIGAALMVLVLSIMLSLRARTPATSTPPATAIAD